MSDRTPWEETFWTPEPLFKGETVFCVASGPSLTQEICDRLRGHKVAVVNSTYKLAPWADLWFFTDNNVFEDNREAIEAFPGLVCTMSRIAKRHLPLKIKRVKGEWMPGFPPRGSALIRQGRSSGHSLVSLLIAMGAAVIPLVGFDMRAIEGREHHHNDYAGRTRDLEIYEREFIPGFSGWYEAALRAGTRIVNATPGSALTEFPMVELGEVL